MGKIVKAIIVYSIITVIILGLSYIINCIAPEASITALPGIHVKAREALNNLTILIMLIPGWVLTLAALIAALARSCEQYF